MSTELITVLEWCLLPPAHPALQVFPADQLRLDVVSCISKFLLSKYSNLWGWPWNKNNNEDHTTFAAVGIGN